MAPRRQAPADLIGIRQRGNRYQVRIFGGMDPATGRQLILTGSAKTQAEAIAVRDGFRKQLDTQTAVRTNVTLAVLLAEWLAGHPAENLARLGHGRPADRAPRAGDGRVFGDGRLSRQS